MKRGLLVVDVQKDFCEGGALAVEGANAIVPVINRLIAEMDFDFIVASGDFHPENHQGFASVQGKEPFTMGKLNGLDELLWPDHCVQGTEGVRWHEELDSHLFDLIMQKGTNPKLHPFSAFKENDGSNPTLLAEILRDNEIEELYVVGLATDFCVKYSGLHAIEDGFKTFMVTDATAGVDVTNSELALTELENLGATLITSADLLNTFE